MARIKLSPETRRRIEEKMKSMTGADWEEVRRKISSDPKLQEELRKIEESEKIGPEDLRIVINARAF